MKRLLTLAAVLSVALMIFGAGQAEAHARHRTKKPHRRAVAAAPAPAQSRGVWDRLAQCESNGRWHINTGNGYYGGLQFSRGTWRGVGGKGYPHHASKAEQISRAEILLARKGGRFTDWPGCRRKLRLP